MTTKHRPAPAAPAPWEQHDRLESGQGILITAQDGAIGVCRVLQRQGHDSDCTPDDLARDLQLCRGNANLLQAAPQLLSACQSVAAEANLMSAEEWEEGTLPEITQRTIWQVIAAIATATGEESPK
jgi:hypothetical protein